MGKSRDRYIAALKYPWLTSLYDPLIGLTMRDTSFKRRLATQARIRGGQRVLDLGCGTVTLTLLIKRMHPNAEVVGLDGDPRVIRIAQAKMSKARLSVALNLGMAFDLPYPDGSFDHVFSSLVFHHLTRMDKERTFQEVSRVLRPGGGLHIADFGKPSNPLMYMVSQVVRRLEPVSDNIQGILPALIQAAGFEEVTESARCMTPFGTLSFYQAKKPSGSGGSRRHRW